MKIASLSFALVACFCFSLFGQDLVAQNARRPVPPKREFRAIWMATVLNIDYPLKPTTEDIAIREEYKNLLDKYKELGFNAVIVQVRPSGDAFYPSNLAPWSKYLTGRQGQAPEPEFDVLEFMVEEAHLRSMEFHAWLNPYRATVDMDSASLDVKHPFNQHRDWLIEHSNKFYLNPAKPEVRDYLTNVVGEIVDYYNVDGIHFDDYFYPYGIKDLGFPDAQDFSFYGRGFDNIEDWRRGNTDALIEMVSKRIKDSKPFVKFGISPFGVWRNIERDPLGSETRTGVTSYDDLYADILKWIRMGWVDYVVPQVYWSIGFEPADYAKIVSWWSGNMGGRHLYVGHAAYKVGDNSDPVWYDPSEIPRQINFNRSNYQTRGSVFFSSRSILRNPLGLRDSLDSYYRSTALIPEMDYLGGTSYADPDLKPLAMRRGMIRVKWKPNRANRDQLPAYYVLYRFEGSKIDNYDDPRNIVHVTPFYQVEKTFRYYDTDLTPGKVYTYVVRAVNRLHAEGPASRAKTIEKLERKFRRLN